MNTYFIVIQHNIFGKIKIKKRNIDYIPSNKPLIVHHKKIQYLKSYNSKDFNIKKKLKFKIKSAEFMPNADLKDLDKIPPTDELISFTCNKNNIKNINFLKSFPSMKQLSLHTNKISDISPLQNLTSLTNINSSNNEISDISPLQNLTKLFHIQLNSNKVTTFDKFKHMNNLKYLSLNNNKISDISQLHKLYSKETTYSIYFKLDLSNNNITNINSLKNSTQLKELDLNNNNIANLSPLTNLKN